MKHIIKLNTTLHFSFGGRDKCWKKGKVLSAAVRSRSEEMVIDGQKCGIEIADLIIFSDKWPTVVLPGVPCEHFSFLDEDPRLQGELNG